MSLCEKAQAEYLKEVLTWAKTAVYSIIGREVRPPGYVYVQSVECEEPCEGRLSRTVLWEGDGETP